MARLPRLSLAGLPHHVILRGNNRQRIVEDDADRQSLLDLLAFHAKDKHVAVHAYVLMDNHLHLLITPEADGAMSKFMQSVGRAYVKRFNERWGRTGTLWEGRFRSGLVQSERHLMSCMAYIDLNPVRAGMVVRPIDFPWSSHRHYVGQGSQRWLTPHALFWGLGNTPFAREQAYEDLVSQGLLPHHIQAMTDTALKGLALGDPEFLEGLKGKTRRRVTTGKPGRPVTKRQNGEESA
jgi:putative transposase